MIWLLTYMTWKKNIIHLFTNKIFCTLCCIVNILVIWQVFPDYAYYMPHSQFMMLIYMYQTIALQDVDIHM